MPHIETINGVPIEPAEVIDARVAHNNRVYDSLGEHIRDVSGDLYYELDTLKQGGYVPDEQLIDSMVSDWLDEHPEATTTVQDGAVTRAKLSSELIQEIDGQFESVEDAVESIEDETKSLNTSYNKAISLHRYLGRLLIDDTYDGKNPQGMCMYTDEIAFAAVSDSSTTNECTIVQVNLSTGSIISKTSTQFAHCNGMAYNELNGMLYVCPSNDYVSGTTVNKLIVCNSTTLDVVEEVEFEFVPHSICYDKITKNMWLVALEDNASVTNLYSFDYDDNTCEFVCEVPDYSDISSHIGFSGYTVGRQQIASYNDELYYLLGGDFNVIINFDINGVIKNTIAPDENIYIYTLVESEGIDFTSSGALVMYSKARLPNNTDYAVFSYFGTGNLFNTNLVNQNEAINAYIDTTADDNVYCIGTSSSPFKSFEEAYNAVRLGYFSRIALSSDVEVKEQFDGSKYVEINLRVFLNNHKITFANMFNATHDLYLANGTVAFSSNMNTPIKSYESDMTFENVTFDCSNITGAIMQVSAGKATFIGCATANDSSISKSHVNLRNESILILKNSPSIFGFNAPNYSTDCIADNAAVAAQATTTFNISKLLSRTPVIVIIGRGDNMGMWLVNSGAVVEVKSNQYVTVTVNASKLEVTSTYAGELGISVIGYNAIDVRKES